MASDVTGVVTGVRDAHRFDEAALARWLAGKLPGAGEGLVVRQFEGGQSNPTYLLETAGRRWVLRKKPSGVLLPSAHMVEREARVLSALAGSAAPVPEVPLFCEDASVIGTPFYVMSYVHGRIVRDPSLPEMSEGERRAVYEDATRTLAALHDVDYAARGLADYGKPSAYVVRQIERWTKQYRASTNRAIAAMDWLIAWLPAHVPPELPATIVHGDFRLENGVLHPTEPRLVAVLDWELSTLGDPLTDLAYFCMTYHLDAGGKGMPGLAGRSVPGIPTEAETVATYCRLRGIAAPAPEVFAFYLAFSLFRLAAILSGVDARARQGNASSANAHEIARQTDTFAAVAQRIAETGA